MKVVLAPVPGHWPGIVTHYEADNTEIKSTWFIAPQHSSLFVCFFQGKCVHCDVQIPEVSTPTIFANIFWRCSKHWHGHLSGCNSSPITFLTMKTEERFVLATSIRLLRQQRKKSSFVEVNQQDVESLITLRVRSLLFCVICALLTECKPPTKPRSKLIWCFFLLTTQAPYPNSPHCPASVLL